jgi:hypothetical protein
MLVMKKVGILVLLCVIGNSVVGQADRWQQRVKYEMNIDFDVNKHQYSGTQKLTYTNNSPDTLTKVFYHLYLNAFQPGSEMDVRSRTIKDPDPRVSNRIEKLAPDEIGYQKIKSLKQNGKSLRYEVVGTILEVTLAQPILPKTSHVFTMEFDAQLPVQIRRTGRRNKEGIDYSVAQWYPKLSEYDSDGWHANPYIAREFHGVWGDFDVKIKIDAAYTVAGTGYLQNPDEIGHGYSSKTLKHRPGNKLTWHFVAPEVHDFVWAADPDYVHDVVKVDKDLDLHFFYQNDSINFWKDMQPLAVQCFKLMNERFGRYPYKQYSVIQGGDGGMEYPMATLITGRQGLHPLTSVTVHEAVHSWFQMLLGTNESKYAWMDEGFTTYAQNEIMAQLFGKIGNPHASTYLGYRRLVETGEEEPITTHADRYKSNRAYSIGSYYKGAIFLNQLNYVVGKEVFDKGMKRYFNEWKYKHPTPNDLKRIMEKESDLELDWFWEDWVGTTKTIDYGIREVVSKGNQTEVVIRRVGEMPMPLDVVVTFKDGSRINYLIPLDLMRGEKKEAMPGTTKLLTDWPWGYPEYTFTVDRAIGDIQEIVIDPTNRIADVNPEDNEYPSDPTSYPRLKGVVK